MQFAQIVLLCIAAACVYGIAHDQVTARGCVEYFTIWHPRIIDSTSPTVLGLVWGVVATWWMGLILGLGVAIAATAGKKPPISCRELVRPVVVVLISMALAALAAGFAGHALATAKRVWLLGPLAEAVPEERHVAFLAALWAHSASYIAGAIGGVVLIVWIVRRRARLAAAR